MRDAVTQSIHRLDCHRSAWRSLAGLIITWDRKGFGLLRNLGVRTVGALVGGLLFRSSAFPGLDSVAISLRDIVAAFVGSLIVLAVFWLWQRYSKSV